MRYKAFFIGDTLEQVSLGSETAWRVEVTNKWKDALAHYDRMCQDDSTYNDFILFKQDLDQLQYWIDNVGAVVAMNRQYVVHTTNPEQHTQRLVTARIKYNGDIDVRANSMQLFLMRWGGSTAIKDDFFSDFISEYVVHILRNTFTMYYDINGNKILDSTDPNIVTTVKIKGMALDLDTTYYIPYCSGNSVKYQKWNYQNYGYNISNEANDNITVTEVPDEDFVIIETAEPAGLVKAAASSIAANVSKQFIQR